MKIERVILNNFKNGNSVDLKKFGLFNVTIKNVYILIDNDLLTFKDWMLNEVALFNDQNVFLEEKINDWDQKNNLFSFYSRRGKRGDLHNLIISYVKLK